MTLTPPATGLGAHVLLAALCEFMKTHALLLARAESCTAGLIAARLADVPGALRHTRAHLPIAHTGVTPPATF